MYDYMRGEGQGRYTNLGKQYFNEFNILFWKRPGNKNN